MHNVTVAADLIEGEDTQAVVADKAYDSDDLIVLIESLGAEAVILPRANRIKQRSYDENLYADRNKVERFINQSGEALPKACHSL